MDICFQFSLKSVLYQRRLDIWHEEEIRMNGKIQDQIDYRVLRPIRLIFTEQMNPDGVN